MKAIRYKEYGPPEVLTLQEIACPVPRPDEVLVRVHATSINSWDWDLVRGEPRIVRMWGLFKPRYQTPGADVAGVVEAVGNKVKSFRPGDEVLGDLCECGFGTLAEYVCAKEKALTKKPGELSFEDASTLPQAGMLALQGIRYLGDLRPGQQVLINGAGGGVGTLALQLAKNYGAAVTCVDLKEKHDLLIQLGADQVIDYTEVDFTTTGKKYDLVLDVVANRAPSACRRALNDKGVYVIAGGDTGILVRSLFARKVNLLMLKPNQGLDELVRMVTSGRIKPVIDQVFPLGETAEAFRYFATGKMKGKVVIKVS
jgi:NADPH:quinone reductase-like Zn-dependent oxidoreductase